MCKEHFSEHQQQQDPMHVIWIEPTPDVDNVASVGDSYNTDGSSDSNNDNTNDDDSMSSSTDDSQSTYSSTSDSKESIQSDSSQHKKAKDSDDNELFTEKEKMKLNSEEDAKLFDPDDHDSDLLDQLSSDVDTNIFTSEFSSNDADSDYVSLTEQRVQ